MSGCAKSTGRRRANFAAILCLACALLFAGCQREPAKRVVLIGGAASEGPGRHAYPDGVRVLQALLGDSPDTRGRIEVRAYPDGWPADAHAFDGAATVVLYFDGLDRHPLRDPQRRAAFEQLMRRGVGVLALHQASTVPPADDLGLPRWLGGVRVGTFDRTTEWAQLQPTMHPVARGIVPFGYRDEFYPTFRFSNAAAGTRTPVLRAVLHPQFRDGRALVDDVPETVEIAWAFERSGGGRSVVYSGTHFLAALDQPGVRRLLLNAVLWTAGLDVPEAGARIPDAARAPARIDPAKTTGPTPPTRTRATFHIDSARSGWRNDEVVLTPEAVAASDFGLAWESPQLASFDGQPPRLYATPLYVGQVAITAGEHRGMTFPAVIAATSNGDVYAINAAKRGDVAPGRILWRRHLAEPCRLQPAPLDGVPTGILGTPVIDLARGRLYVTHCDPKHRWQAYALDLGSGEVLAGWPVRLDEESFNALNRNAGPERVPPKRRFDFRVQRGALNLSPDGTLLHVVFGETETGWLVAVDTQAATLRSAFAAVAMPHRGSGGIWGAGGPAIDAEGNVYVVTGSGFDGYKAQAHDWTQSVLKLSMGADGFVLRGTYTPFNHCVTAKNDIDLGSGGVMLPPDLPADATATPRLLAVGGKQGNAYLLDRDRLPGRLDRRPACTTDAASDDSMLPPQVQPQFGTRGPLSVFGPYSERDAALDLARARSLPASFRDARGNTYLYVTGNSKRAQGSADSVPPSVARLRIEAASGKPAYLRIDRVNRTLLLGNPGSPVVTSNGSRDALVWILDENAPRSALLTGGDSPRPVLYALDGDTLEVLWRSAPGELATSGKYNEPAFGGGLVFVGTDRIQAFGPGGTRGENRHVPKAVTAQPQPAPAASDVARLDAKAIYGQRCAMCHDHPQGNIPPRARLATLPRDRIVTALTSGVMRPQAQGLNPEQIAALARFLKGDRPKP
jgi:outer membrane protein assembly factor BamB